MITVKPFLEMYCEERKLPPPSKIDLESCGRIVSHHFKYYWAKNYFPDGLIPDCGFLVSIEGEIKFVIQGYPDAFKSEMTTRIDLYYSQKNKPKISPESIPLPATHPQLSESEILPPAKPKKERKRKPFPVKVGSFKPQNESGQISGQS